MAIVHHQIQPMDDGVFNDGLQGDLVAQTVYAVLIHRKMIGKLVFVAVFLDLQVGLGVLQLLFDRDQLMPAADADAEQPRQCMDHLDGIGVFAALTHPGDGIQRIVEKMRVDLRLQRLELCLAQDDFLLAHGGHQSLDTPDHVAEGIRKVLHLPRAAHRAKDKVVGILLKCLHCVLQLLERAAQQAGQHPAHRQRRRKDQRCRCHSDAHHLPEAFVDGLINVADADNAPWAVRHALDTVDDSILHIGAVTKAGQTAGLLLFQARVEKLLLRVVDHIAALIHQVAVAVLADAHIVDGGGQS